MRTSYATLLLVVGLIVSTVLGTPQQHVSSSLVRREASPGNSGSRPSRGKYKKLPPAPSDDPALESLPRMYRPRPHDRGHGPHYRPDSYVRSSAWYADRLKGAYIMADRQREWSQRQLQQQRRCSLFPLVGRLPPQTPRSSTRYTGSAPASQSRRVDSPSSLSSSRREQSHRGEQQNAVPSQVPVPAPAACPTSTVGYEPMDTSDVCPTDTISFGTICSSDSVGAFTTLCMPWPPLPVQLAGLVGTRHKGHCPVGMHCRPYLTSDYEGEGVSVTAEATLGTVRRQSGDRKGKQVQGDEDEEENPPWNQPFDSPRASDSNAASSSTAPRYTTARDNQLDESFDNPHPPPPGDFPQIVCVPRPEGAVRGDLFRSASERALERSRPGIYIGGVPGVRVIGRSGDRHTATTVVRRPVPMQSADYDEEEGEEEDGQVPVVEVDVPEVIDWSIGTSDDDEDEDEDERVPVIGVDVPEVVDWHVSSSSSSSSEEEESNSEEEEEVTATGWEATDNQPVHPLHTPEWDALEAWLADWKMSTKPR